MASQLSETVHVKRPRRREVRRGLCACRKPLSNSQDASTNLTRPAWFQLIDDGEHVTPSPLRTYQSAPAFLDRQQLSRARCEPEKARACRTSLTLLPAIAYSVHCEPTTSTSCIPTWSESRSATATLSSFRIDRSNSSISSRRGLPPLSPSPLPTRPWRSEWLAARAWLVSLSCSEATALPTGSSSRVQAKHCALQLRTSSASWSLGDRCRTAFCSMYKPSWFRSARRLRQTHASAPASVSLAGY